MVTLSPRTASARRPGQIFQRAGISRHVVKKRRVIDVSGLRIPGVEIAFRDRQRFPVFIAGVHVGIFFSEHVAGNGRAHGGFHFRRCGPNIAQVNGLSGFVVAERLVHDVEIHTARQCVGHHQRRRRQIIRAAQRIDAAFEIAIAAQHGNGEKIVSLDRLADGLGKRAAVADACGAAVAHQIEMQRIQVGPQAGFFDVVSDNFRAGSETGFYPGLGS